MGRLQLVVTTSYRYAHSKLFIQKEYKEDPERFAFLDAVNPNYFWMDQQRSILFPDRRIAEKASLLQTQ